MKLIAGVDVGNSTTEVCLSRVRDDNKIEFLSSDIKPTTGTKGTTENVSGIINAISDAAFKIGANISDINLVRINEAAPVIGDTAMETITETIITDSTMIGHNPSTPGGAGIGVGIIIDILSLPRINDDRDYIVLVGEGISYEAAAEYINDAAARNISIKAAIVKADEAVLIFNRLKNKIPIVDEVQNIERVPKNVLGAVEVAEMGMSIKILSNPYGIASIFKLNAEETKRVVPAAKSLIGTRSAVVIRTPEGEVKEKIIPAGNLNFYYKNNVMKIDIDSGADEIMKIVESIDNIEDVQGEAGTNIGGMINGVKGTMANLTNQNASNIKIKDILAIDTTVPEIVTGGIAGETYMEKAVAIAAMVKTDKLPMLKIAEKLNEKLGVEVKIAGVEAVMAVLGAMTTPGTKLPLAILDLGGGSTDAAILNENGQVISIHLAGAGELVTMLINSELGLKDRFIAEEIKKNPVAKVESLFHIRMENGEIKFFSDPLNPRYYGRVVVLRNKEMIPIEKDVTLEKIVHIRKLMKKKVFVMNAVRALKKIAPMNNLRNIPNVVLVGGSALDFEIPEMILEELSQYKIVVGRGNIRSIEGPRNAVATGLVMSYAG